MSSNSDESSTSGAAPVAGSSAALDALETVRRHPSWFFRDGEFEPHEAAQLLADEALRSGAETVTVRRQGDWFSVEADRDWLRGDLAAFFTPQSYAAGGRNSTRVEVVLTAFCSAVITATDDGVHEVSSSPDSNLRLQDLQIPSTPTGRVVAFLPPALERTAPQPKRQTGQRAAQPNLRLVQGEGERSIVSAVNSFVHKQQALRHG
jgi:hypothetical protein